MEHSISTEAQGEAIPPHIEAAPWNKPGRYWVLSAVTLYVNKELGVTAWWLATNEEWHAILLDAYNEMISLGLLLPEDDV